MKSLFRELSAAALIFPILRIGFISGFQIYNCRMDDKQQFADLPVVTESTPTADGKGRLYQLEPGMRVVLDQYDHWRHNQSESMLKQCRRVFLSDKESQRRKDGAQRLKERLGRVPFYAEAARKHSNGDEYWERFYASRIHL